MELKFAQDIFVKEGNRTFVVAEIGQNHQGDIKEAKKLIKAAKISGADCVKFQKSHLKSKFTKKALEREYINTNSWGKTYGDHKEFLEFSEEQFEDLQKFAESLKILFTASAMDLKSLEFLYNINVPFIKIGSGDANNFPLIDKAAKLHKPLIISTGMQTMKTIEEIYKLVSKHHQQFALMHCVSSYPCKEEDINLNLIKVYKEKFKVPIGYSGHEIGYSLSTAAVIAGATIIERHFTFDKNQKGSDHKCSLIPEEFSHMVQEIRRMECLLGRRDKVVLSSELNCRRKLGKSLVASRMIASNATLRLEDIDVKVSEPPGISAEEIYAIVGRKVMNTIEYDQPITHENLL